MRLTAVLLLGMATGLTACGTGPERKQGPSSSASATGQTPGPPSGAQAPLQTPGWKAVVNPYLDPRLDPIRDKVPLVLRSGAVTAAHLGNGSRPTREEKGAIKLWQEIREKAHEARSRPSPLLVQTRLRVTRAITQLYAGQLTYGEFARRVQQIDAQHQAARRQGPGRQD